MRKLHQYGFLCVDSDNNLFQAFTKAKSKQHATAIIEDRIACEAATKNRSALNPDEMTYYKRIKRGAKQAMWTMPSLV